MACLGFLSACTTENTDSVAQAQVDSLANAKVTIIQFQLKRNNDSIINALAVERADSILRTQAQVAVIPNPYIPAITATDTTKKSVKSHHAR